MRIRIVNKNRNATLFSILSELYTFTIIMAPILCIYGIGISTITFLDFLLIVLNILMIIDLLYRKKLSIFVNLIPFCIYICITALFNIYDSEVILRTFRYLFYILNVIIFVPNYFKYYLGIKIYKIVAWVSTVFLFIQIISNKILGIYIPGVLPNIHLVDADLYNYNEVFQMAQVKRVMSFFAEPSHYAIFILGYFVITLFYRNKTSTFKGKLCEAAFLSLGIILSSSILGMVVMLVMWAIWIIFNFKKFILKPYMILLMLLMIFVLYILLIDTSAVQYMTNSTVIERQSAGRFSGYEFLRSSNISLGEKIFGQGMTKEGMSVYLASYPILIFYFGYIGLILCIGTFLPYISKFKNNEATALLICMLGISIGSEILVGNFILIFFSFVILGFRKIK